MFPELNEMYTNNLQENNICGKGIHKMPLMLLYK
jgi:hypothetical protein